MIQNDYTTTIAPRRSPLDRRFGFDRIDTEMLLYVLLFGLSIFLHIWQLDVKAMHHDESIHAWMSYKFFNGLGPFTCAGGGQSDTYCYDPVYHGPSLYVLTLFSYFLFGVGDAQSRLPMALAGIGLVPMAWTLRSFIGRKGAFLAAVLMTISPSLLYYTRFARHDALVLLWSLFMVVGIFKFIRDGGAFNLSLALAGLALTWATHELVFILLFIGGSFLGFRMLWEWRPLVFFVAVAAALAISIFLILLTIGVSEAQAPGLYSVLHRLLGPVLLLGVGTLLILPMALAWEREPIVLERLRDTWRDERGVYGVALATFLVIFTLLFTTFFAYPKGFLDGWYQGINYWLGSQHEFARGDQPWFYYLMLLPIYDLLALLFGLAGVGWLIFAGLYRLFVRLFQRVADPVTADTATPEAGSNGDGHAEILAEQPVANGHYASAASWTPPLLVFFLGYWFIQAFVGFSWAGEKMPWLLTHISLPASLMTAWVLGRLINRVPWRELRHDYGWTVPLLTLLLVSSTFVAAYAFSGSSQTIDGLRARLQGLIPVIFAGLCMFGLLTVGSWYGWRVVGRLAALTVAAVLFLYGIRAATFVVYRHPDTPVEPLIYTQTAPDVPILVRQIEQISINQTRNKRTADDPTGGLTMPLMIDGGGSQHSGEGSLAWPLQWYLRDYKGIRWFDVDTNSTITNEAPMIVLYKPHVTEDLRSQLEEEYVKTSEGVFNWWFPEHSDTNENGESTRGYKTVGAEGLGAVLSWPLNPANWPTLAKYMVYRELPLELKGREMEVYMRRDVAPGGGGVQANAIPTESIKADEVLTQPDLNGARGIAVDNNGNVYIANSLKHQILVVSPSGEQLRTIGSLGNGEGQLNEPSGVAVDDDGNVYVADTWNSRVVKFAADGSFITHWGTSTTPFGDSFTDPQSGATIQRFATDNRGDLAANEQNPLGFFGPRNVLVLDDRLYIADTGNSRIVVTDLNGQFVQQFGSRGNAAGQLHEPIGLGKDDQGLLYVGDTWNGRVQAFQRSTDGTIDPLPAKTIEVRGWVANTYTDPYIAVAPDGRLWATLGGRNQIAAYDQTQQNPRRLKSDPTLDAPKGIAFGPNGLVVLSSARNELLRFSAGLQ